MASFRQTREVLLLAHSEDLLNTEEFCLLYDINKSKNLDYPYWNYEAFNFDSLSEDECQAEFRFAKGDIWRLADVLNIPNEFSTYNRPRFDGFEAFCVFLNRFSYPC